MPKPKKSILLRIPAELAERLNHWAQAELRSLNAQIEYLLREAVRRRYGARGLGQPQDTGSDQLPNPTAERQEAKPEERRPADPEGDDDPE
jgi:hypothetical protein